MSNFPQTSPTYPERATREMLQVREGFANGLVLSMILWGILIAAFLVLR